MPGVREDGAQPARQNDDRSRRWRGVQKIRNVRERARQQPALDLTWRAGVLMIGVAFLSAGIAGLILPALPGWGLIFVGLGVLATEFAWAERLLAKAREKALTVAAHAMDPSRRRRNRIVLTVAVIVLAGSVAVYVLTYGLARAPWLGGQ